MIKEEILKDRDFEAVAEARIDAKRRVTLGHAALASQVTSFRVYQNAHGQIILDPMVSVPAHEAWLFKNRKALAMVRRGVEDAKHGRFIRSKKDFSKFVDDRRA